MTFQPVVVGTGLVGWQFLKSTATSQREAFDASPLLARDTDYFAQNIASVTSAEELVADRRLLRVALGAFGLQDDIDNKFFIQKILAEGTTDPDALANKLTDERYKAMAKRFGFGSLLGPATATPGFAQDIISRYRAQEFEVAVGAQDDSLRLGLNFERSLGEFNSSSPDAAWFRVMGTPPLRTVLEGALGLPSSFAQLDIDKQLETFRDKMKSRFGVSEIAEIAAPDNSERVVQAYLLQEQVSQFRQSGSAQIALTLLQAIPRRSLLGGVSG